MDYKEKADIQRKLLAQTGINMLMDNLDSYTDAEMLENKMKVSINIEITGPSLDK